MPWVRKSTRPRNPYWTSVLIALAALGVGILIGYTKWGATAAIVTLVEKELAETQTHIKVLEKRMTDMEARIIGGEAASGSTERGTGAVKKPEGKATRNRFESDKEKQAWNGQSRL
ncbi:MAG TPA: hypothetical protein VMO00_06595 [Methylomirabilota bacterium]|nr:hypothetical protein [Methylomirabilota bacterium]